MQCSFPNTHLRTIPTLKGVSGPHVIHSRKEKFTQRKVNNFQYSSWFSRKISRLNSPFAVKPFPHSPSFVDEQQSSASGM